MDTILHVVDIHASPETIFKAVSTGEGLAGWWSTKVTAPEEIGGIVDFTFGGDFNPDMEITALESPGLVSWRCVGGHVPWQDSTFSFAVLDMESGTHTARFHSGLRRSNQ
jgi:uncharacterized protein YndB with AHSA1/START domain